ncbi:MAG: MogA/MoaB family molybdenum cofactor biosynthesis protein [Carboxydocellales bacterium]
MRRFTVGILTASDKGFRGERPDLSGQVIREMIGDLEGEVVRYEIVPDELEVIKENLIHFADNDHLDLVLTTGGTGLGPRDVTPDATLEVVEKLVPGIPEAMRMESMKKTNRAMLSRAVAGVRHRTLIINLPGSPKAVKECLEVILPVLNHGLEILKGTGGECARRD